MNTFNPLKRLLSAVVMSAVVAGVSPNSPAATIVKQDISRNSVWTAGKSPYVVTDDIVIKKHVILKIEPGVRVELAPEKTIEIQGKLTAVGSPERPVIFTAHRESPWGSIYFTDFSDDAAFSEHGRYIDGCILKNCIIEKGRGIFIRFGAPLITDCEIRNNFSSGIRVEF
ncbi:MAG: hypothetical protein JSV16_06035, partial [Candidatus Hydrogenedentota bacterium]